MSELCIKICGVTRPRDAELCVEAGASWIGLNFVAASPRRIDASTSLAIRRAVGDRAVLVGVVADEPAPRLLRLRDDAKLDRLQLHGDEPAEALRALAPFAYKALRIRDATDVTRAADYGGDPLLVDAFVAGKLGGTGVALRPELVEPLARARRILLAGGLTPETVGDAIRAVRPWGVDVASGVEASPGIKDAQKVSAFIERALAAAREVAALP